MSSDWTIDQLREHYAELDKVREKLREQEIASLRELIVATFAERDKAVMLALNSVEKRQGAGLQLMSMALSVVAVMISISVAVLKYLE